MSLKNGLFLMNGNLFSVIFAAGKPLYKIVRPEGNLIVKVSKCICVSPYNIILQFPITRLKHS